MKTKRIALLSLIGLLLFAGTAAAQTNDVITAEVDRTALTTDDLLTLTITVDQTQTPAEPQLPAFDGFTLLGQNSSTQISIVNGDMAFQAVYTFYLQPTQAGTLTINPITVQAGGQPYQTAPIEIQVAQGAGQTQPQVPSGPGALPGVPNLGQLLPGLLGGIPGSQPPPSGGTIPAPSGLTGQDYFVEATVDKTNPFMGEQVLYTFRFYQGASLLNEPDYREPGFTGFWHEQQSQQQMTYTTEAAGRTYYVNELVTVLFPTVSGDLVIDPATLVLPGDMFSAGQTLSTEPLAVSVRPLPDNPPPDFQGAVGQYTVQAMVDKTSSQVNDAVTLQVTQSGAGNLNTVGDLAWTVGPEWRPFDAKANSSTSFANGALTTTRIYEQILVPTQPGDLSIPPIRFSYFDPTQGAYQTIETQPIVVQVAADPNAPLTTVGDPLAVNQPGAASESLRPLKAAPASWRAEAPALPSRPLYWLLWLAPLLLIGGTALLTGVARRREAGAPERRRQMAADAAARELSRARQAGEPAAEAGICVLETYLEAKLGRPVGGLTHDALGRLLVERGADEKGVRSLIDCRRRLDDARFMPAAPAGDAVLFDAVEAAIRGVDPAL